MGIDDPWSSMDDEDQLELVSSMAAGGDFVAPLFPARNDGRSGRLSGGAPPDLRPARQRSRLAPPTGLNYPLALLSHKAHAFLNSQYGNMHKQLDL